MGLLVVILGVNQHVSGLKHDVVGEGMRDSGVTPDLAAIARVRSTSVRVLATIERP